MSVLFVFIRNSIAQFIVQGFTYYVQVPVFTKNGWNKKPVISRSHPAITAVITIKCSLLKFRHVRRLPLIMIRPVYKRIGSMFGILRIHPVSLCDIELDFSNQHAVHDDLITSMHILHKKFMLGANIFLQNIFRSLIRNAFTFCQILQCNQHIIVGMDF